MLRYLTPSHRPSLMSRRSAAFRIAAWLHRESAWRYRHERGAAKKELIGPFEFRFASTLA